MSRLFSLIAGALLLVGGPGRAQNMADRVPAPAIRFFAVPWLEAGPAWHTGRSNTYYQFRGSTARYHLGGGLAVEMLPTPTIGVGLGVGVTGMGGTYTATFRATEFFSNSPVTYRVVRALDLTYLQLPLYVRVTPYLRGGLRGYALAGVQPALRLSVRADGSDFDDAGRAYDDYYGFLDGALLGGVGLEWWLNGNTALLAGLRYRHGVVGVQDERPPYPGGDNPPGFPLRSYQTPPAVTYPLRNRSLTLELAVKFGPTRRAAPSAPAVPQRQEPPRLQTL